MAWRRPAVKGRHPSRQGPLTSRTPHPLRTDVTNMQKVPLTVHTAASLKGRAQGFPFSQRTCTRPHPDAALCCQLLRDLQREAVGVVQLEGGRAADGGGTRGAGIRAARGRRRVKHLAQLAFACAGRPPGPGCWFDTHMPAR